MTIDPAGERTLINRFNPEMVIGFFSGLIFFLLISGWLAAYSPSEIERDKCREAAEKTGFKAENCKTLWEKTTSDPVALFTLALVVSTVGLWVATIMLYRAGERQSKIANRNTIATERSADVARDTLIASQRAWVKVGDPTITFDEPNPTKGIKINVLLPLHNVGQIPATNINIDAWISFIGIKGYSEKPFVDRCELLRTSYDYRSFTMFPGESRINVSIDNSIIVRASWYEIEEAFLDITESSNVIFLLMGCVTYSFPTDNEKRHQTRFVYRTFVSPEFSLNRENRYEVDKLLPFQVFSHFLAD